MLGGRNVVFSVVVSLQQRWGSRSCILTAPPGPELLIVKDNGSRRAVTNFAALSAKLREVLESDAGFKAARTVRLLVYI